ncbi:hypothetical protein IO384_001004 [Campylobacter lari]|uniref:hypothetical protein n=1 Tax=Campylobacter sp. CNRCH_2014_2452 TaxID=2911603 RepID=UPI00128725CB|nr:hypothetical protein [Campylobacter sp. CNRCH_2014_2452]EAK0818252.1 hypothetical protein [Campylobacter lari]EAK9890882.1 hypothetical protein [Campylobacter lari]EGK8025296.1 hypothetical protein [Campylobacter lari]EGK8129339.1 hypothetical protein [Campylobacter lari]MCV3485313.1 hypothetical protein [Campylobacter sp. CNRCH_2014_2452]
MIVISHRGFWFKEIEKNTLKAFERSFCNDFGIETDLRDMLEQIVISHDMSNSSCLTLDDFFALYKRFSNNFPLALNIKADGLQSILKEFLEKYNVNNYFVFDMSVPDALLYIKAGFNVFTRQSEYEKQPSFYNEACGVWMDEFYEHWIDEKIIQGHLENNKKICIVSPELHKRGFKKEWQEYKEIFKKLDNDDNLMLCTDYPIQAREFFNV